MNLQLEGKAAAVAAASAGLGYAAASALAAEGVQVAICGRNRERVEAAAMGIGDQAFPLVIDVSTPDGATNFIARSSEALGRPPDIVVANGGGPPVAGFREADLPAFRQALEGNLLSAIAMCHAAAPAMQVRRWGRVVAITSITVKQPSSTLILSTTARAALHGFLKVMANELAPDGITVNAVMPGAHATERLKAVYGDSPPTDKIPMRRFGAPSDFGATVAFLCSEQAGFITGSSLLIDGGEYAGWL